MNNIQRNLTVEHTVDDFSKATIGIDYDIEDLVSYVESAADVFYWINIESIWGKLGFRWDTFNNVGHFGDIQYPFLELPLVPDSYRVLSFLNMFVNTPYVNVIYDNDWVNLTDIRNIYSGSGSLKECTMYLLSAKNLSLIGGNVKYRIYADLSNIDWESSSNTRLILNNNNINLWKINPFDIYSIKGYNTYNRHVYIYLDDKDAPNLLKSSEIISEPPIDIDNIDSLVTILIGGDYARLSHLPILLLTKPNLKLHINVFRYKDRYVSLLNYHINKGLNIILQGNDVEGKEPVPLDLTSILSSVFSENRNNYYNTVDALSKCKVTYKDIYYEPFKYIGEVKITDPSLIDFDYNLFINPNARVKEYNGHELFFSNNTLDYNALKNNPLVVDFSLDWVKNNRLNFNNSSNIKISTLNKSNSPLEAYNRVRNFINPEDFGFFILTKVCFPDYRTYLLKLYEHGIVIYRTGVKILNYDNLRPIYDNYINTRVVDGTMADLEFVFKITEGVDYYYSTGDSIILDLNKTIPNDCDIIYIYLFDKVSKAKFLKHTRSRPIIIKVNDISLLKTNNIRQFFDYSEFESLNEFYKYYKLDIHPFDNYTTSYPNLYFPADATILDFSFITLDFKVPFNYIKVPYNNPIFNTVLECVRNFKSLEWPVLLPLDKIAYILPSNINISARGRYYLTNVEGKHSNDEEGVATFCSLFKIPETPPAKDSYTLTLNSELYQYFTEELKTMLIEQCGYKIVEVLN